MPYGAGRGNRASQKVNYSRPDYLSRKEADYRDLSVTRGHPSRVIWIRLGNGPTSDVASLLRNRYDDLTNFYRDDRSGLLELL